MISQPHRHVRRAGTLTALAACCLFAVAATLPAAEPDAAQLEQVRTTAGQALVTLKCVISLKIGGRGAGGDQEMETELPGLMIDPAGLVLCSNTQLGGIGSMVSRIFGGSIPGFSMSSDVVDVKVLVGTDEEELPGKVLARDADLDLAWVQIEAGDRKFPTITWASDPQLGLGARLVGVRQMGKHFDRLSVIGLFTVVGETEKPRTLWITQEPLSSFLGLPLLTVDGQAVGVAVVQAPEAEAGGSMSNPFAMLGSLSSMQEGLQGLILPAAEIEKATARAKAAAASGDDDAAPKNEAEETEGEEKSAEGSDA